jgi:zinc resistance-associated protein
MWSPVLVGAAVIAIAGSSIVFAQQMEGEGERGQSSRVSQDDRTGLGDGRLASRLASLRERLRLTPEQEKNWPAYESARQALAKHRRERMQAWHEQSRPTDPTQQMRQRAEALSGTGAALSRLADAQERLYNSLDEGQKRRFATLSQMLGDQGDMHRWSRARDDDDDLRGWHGRDDDNDRRGWRGRGDDGDRRGWRGRGDDGDRRGWHARSDDGDRRGWRGRGEDCDRRGWRSWGDDYDRRGWRSRRDGGGRDRDDDDD